MLDAKCGHRIGGVVAIALGLACAAFVPCAHAATAYVPYTQSGNVAVVNTTTQSVTTTINGFGTTWSAALSPTGTIAYVAGFSSNLITPINTATNATGTPIAVGNGPVNVTFSPDGALAYVSNWADNSMSIVDVAGAAVSSTLAGVCTGGTAPVQSLYTASGLYFVCMGAPSLVRRMNTSTHVISDVVTIAGEAYNLAISTAANLLYVSSWGGNTVTAVSLASNTVVATINGFTQPLGIAITPNGSKVLVGDYGSTNLSIIDTATNAVTTTLNLGANIAGLGMSSNGSVVYAVLQGAGGGIAVIDTGTNTVVSTIATPIGTSASAIWGDFLGNVAALPPNTYAVGGTVSGLAAGEQVVLLNNGADNLTVLANGNFTFSAGLASAAAYAVTVGIAPAGKTCSVTNGSGVVGSADITNIAVACAGATAVGAIAVPSLSEWGLFILSGLMAMMYLVHLALPTQRSAAKSRQED